MLFQEVEYRVSGLVDWQLATLRRQIQTCVISCVIHSIIDTKIIKNLISIFIRKYRDSIYQFKIKTQQISIDNAISQFKLMYILNRAWVSVVDKGGLRRLTYVRPIDLVRQRAVVVIVILKCKQRANQSSSSFFEVDKKLIAIVILISKPRVIRHRIVILKSKPRNNRHRHP